MGEVRRQCGLPLTDNIRAGALKVMTHVRPVVLTVGGTGSTTGAGRRRFGVRFAGCGVAMSNSAVWAVIVGPPFWRCAATVGVVPVGRVGCGGAPTLRRGGRRTGCRRRSCRHLAAV